tara:strand:- start:228 stop:671 length:444 start_codon:yes stop_codon:yes gene_type:complete
MEGQGDSSKLFLIRVDGTKFCFPKQLPRPKDKRTPMPECIIMDVDEKNSKSQQCSLLKNFDSIQYEITGEYVVTGKNWVFDVICTPNGWKSPIVVIGFTPEQKEGAIFPQFGHLKMSFEEECGWGKHFNDFQKVAKKYAKEQKLWEK